MANASRQQRWRARGGNEKDFERTLLDRPLCFERFRRGRTDEKAWNRASYEATGTDPLSLSRRKDRSAQAFAPAAKFDDRLGEVGPGLQLTRRRRRHSSFEQSAALYSEEETSALTSILYFLILL